MALYEELLILLPWLKNHPGVTIPEVADHFGYTPDQVKQYIMLLACTGPSELDGVLIDINYEGDAININETLTIDRPFSFDAVEAACLLAGLDSLAALPAVADGWTMADVESARHKLMALLDGRPRLEISAGTAGGYAELQTAIREAIESDRQLEIAYWNVARDDIRIRAVSPFRISALNHEAVLAGFDHSSTGWRSFRLDRIQTCRPLDQQRQFPAEPFTEMPAQSVVISLPAHRQHLLENFSVANRSEGSDGRIQAEVKVYLPRWLARQVLASGLEIRVEQPAEVVAEVAALVAGAQRAYLSH